MNYHGELELLRNTLNKCHVRSAVLYDEMDADNGFDNLLAAVLFEQNKDDNGRIRISSTILPDTVYRYSDHFGCQYIYTLLPEFENKSILVIGPYKSKLITDEEFLELLESNGLETTLSKDIRTIYNNAPIIDVDSSLFTLIDAFGERIWNENYTLVDINASTDFSLPINVNSSDSDSGRIDFEAMEMRYSVENQLMDAVSKGHHHKLELIFGNFSSISFERRLADPVRNLKNYSIIMNTLLRKAAENGGVHPFYIDSISANFARFIENASSLDDLDSMVPYMIRSYCDLVKKRSTALYSEPVRQILVTIDASLDSDLSLKRFANELFLNTSYLSSLFKKETGLTLTDYVNQHRIDYAKRLLKSTTMTIQTVASTVGISDIHYFTRLFRRIAGCSPREFRKS